VVRRKRGHKRNSKPPLSKRNGAKFKEDRLGGASNRGSKAARSEIGAINDEGDLPTGDNNSWGKGGILKDTSSPHEVNKDIALIQRALKGRWNIKKKALIQDRLLEVLAKQEVTVPTKDGAITLDEPADRNAVAAARVLVQMHGQDIECDEFEVKNAKPPAPGTQVNVFSANSSQSGTSPIVQLALKLGARELIIDGSAVPVTNNTGESS
jgi:hypothetical protein